MFQQPFYPHQPGFPNNRGPTNHFMPSRPFFYRPNGSVINQSTHNFNFTRDFERFPMPHHGFTSVPSGNYPPFYDFNNQQFEQQRWRQNMARPSQQQQQQQQHRRTPAFHFQDQSTSYFMTDPIVTNDDRLTIQLTKVHIGPNGDQQRVFVEQEFSNEKELNKFVRNLRHNFEKTFNNRSSDHNSINSDESNCTDSKKSGVIVIEEPDEEPKVYQQQVYNANIETKKATSSIITPPMSPPMESVPPPKLEDHSQPSKREHRRTKHMSPSTSQMSSSSTTRSRRRHKNKMKYRRQQIDNREEPKLSHPFPMSSFSRQFQSTPIPSSFQQRFYPRDNSFRMKTPFTIPTNPNPNPQWRFNQHGNPKTRSRSYVPPMNDHFPPPPPTPSRFHNPIDPFFQSIHSSKFSHHRHKDSHVPSSPTKAHRSQRRQSYHPTTIAENHVYPHNEQQQPRVQRTKSECQNFQQQQQKSQSTTNFPNFSPLQQPPIIQRHFTPFRSPPVIPPSVNTTVPLFYPNQRRQFGHMQTPLHLIKTFRLSTNRF
ncbi:unnamed protein product [Rotaria sordida]|uniref:Uncharacterized protein n=1 Tax=Rotaria sordida TaxID=392033 RepID=A0A813VSV8_9BILA|nr:unnamed protein product [Rotaria sordida]CAF0848623.1 unnamed protein product [Rotaria sordida]CAF0850378.1 unnamed protein product [Rotaria sordida]CAF0851441.1 unnamed protein product [Rotaria sordida]CAF0892085.1 unnamed protein product [Rotaria sordida]